MPRSLLSPARTLASLAVYFKVKKGGGISFTATVKLTHLSEKLVSQILRDYKVHNAEVLIREDVTVDDFIDVVLGNRKYMRALYVYNKIDAISLEEVDRLAREPDSVVISVSHSINLDGLVDAIWRNLQLTRVYTKKRGEYPDLAHGLVVRKGATIEDFCHRIHRSLANDFKYALVWGTSAKHQPQRVGLKHVLENEDVVQVGCLRGELSWMGLTWFVWALSVQIVKK